MPTEQERKAILCKASYKLGFQVGYHHHDEFYGWVNENKKKMEFQADKMGLRELVARYYNKGKVDGSTKAIRDRAAGADKDKSERWKIYEQVLDQAWSDDAMTEDEEKMVKVLNQNLHLGKKDFEKLTRYDRQHLYKQVLVQAWEDGVVTQEEQDILDNLAETLTLAASEVFQISQEVKEERKALKDKEKKTTALPDGGEKRMVGCPQCKTKFRINIDAAVAKCPKCGYQGKLK